MTLLPLKPARFGSHMVGFLIIALSVVATSAKGWAGENNAADVYRAEWDRASRFPYVGFSGEP